MIEIQSVSAEAFISEIAADNPAPQEKWFHRDDFDPTYGMKELREAQRRGWIELDTSSGDALTYRFRLTQEGRAIIE